jgi:nucleotide-binding universal stress UspA family protein
MLKIRTILHPTDFSECSEYAFFMACALARDYGAKLLLLHVKPLPTALYGEFGAFPTETADSIEELKNRMLAIKPSDPSIPVERRLIEGEISEEIIRLSQDQSCDLIVLGTHGRTGLQRLLMGSVAEQVMRKAACPVLTVKGPILEEALTPEETAATGETT